MYVYRNIYLYIVIMKAVSPLNGICGNSCMYIKCSSA